MEHAAGIGTWIEQSALGLAIRDAVLVYPVANVLHVLAVLVFFASVAMMDLRLLGILRGDPLGLVLHRGRGMAKRALFVLVATGAVLFIPEAGAMLRNASFQLKGLAILLALANVLLLDRLLPRPDLVPAGSVPGFGIRLLAILSLLLWLAVAGLGRFIAYA